MSKEFTDNLSYLTIVQEQILANEVFSLFAVVKRRTKRVHRTTKAIPSNQNVFPPRDLIISRPS